MKRWIENLKKIEDYKNLRKDEKLYYHIYKGEIKNLIIIIN